MAEAPSIPARFNGPLARGNGGYRSGLLAGLPDGPVAGSEHVVVAWPIAAEGRKRWAGSAILSAEGAPLAFARALLIESRQAPAES